MSDDYAAEVDALFTDLESGPAGDLAKVDFTTFDVARQRLDGSIERLTVRLMTFDDWAAKRLPPT